jgi:excisionase family DNA binding protein
MTAEKAPGSKMLRLRIGPVGDLLTREDLTSALLEVARRAPPPKKWLSPREAADYLGVAMSTLYAWKSQKKLKAATVGGVVRFDVQNLDDFLTRHTK